MRGVQAYSTTPPIRVEPDGPGEGEAGGSDMGGSDMGGSDMGRGGGGRGLCISDIDHMPLLVYPASPSMPILIALTGIAGAGGGWRLALIVAYFSGQMCSIGEL